MDVKGNSKGDSERRRAVEGASIVLGNTFIVANIMLVETRIITTALSVTRLWGPCDRCSVPSGQRGGLLPHKDGCTSFNPGIVTGMKSSTRITEADPLPLKDQSLLNTEKYLKYGICAGLWIQVHSYSEFNSLKCFYI